MTKPLIWSVLSFLLGMLCGHRFTISRNRRQEYNQLADELFVRWSRLKGNISAYTSSPDPVDIASLRRRMGWFKAWQFDRAVERFKHAEANTRCHQNDFNEVIYDDTTEVEEALGNLIKQLRRK